MTYLVDTCVVSAFFRKEKQVVETLKRLSPSDIKVSTITVMEIEYGLELNPSIRPRIQPLWTSFKGEIEVLTFDERDAFFAAHTRSILKKEGKPIGTYDILLAGMAKCRNLIFVTNNISEFTRIEGLIVETWIDNH